MTTYKLKLILVECREQAEQKILRSEELACFETEREAQETLELIELPDPKHNDVI
jgi:uncharacterized protein YnzC (UPF0291/DUF896 family)